MINWGPAPIKIQYGDGMVIADIELDKDHTLTLVCEQEAQHLVRDALIKLLKSL